MKINQKINDDFYLAKWLNGEITDEELSKIVSSDEVTIYKKIKEKLNYFVPPLFNSENTKQQIDESIGAYHPKQKAYKVTNWLYAAVAIAVFIAVGYWYNLHKPTRFVTQIGERLNYELPDGSTVAINSNSEIHFVKKTWKTKREVDLSGEAFFKVKKGKTFIVQTNNGQIQVFGTSFNVLSKDDFFSVHCFSGKVRVIHLKDTVFLVKGNALQYYDKHKKLWKFVDDQPSWLNHESTFKSVPLRIVIRSIEDQYGIIIKSENIDENQIFTGAFNYNNLDIALKSVFYPMGINYKINNKTVILSKK